MLSRTSSSGFRRYKSQLPVVIGLLSLVLGSGRTALYGTTTNAADESLQESIDRIQEQGGGRLLLPKGVYELSRRPNTDACLSLTSDLELIGEPGTIIRLRSDQLADRRLRLVEADDVDNLTIRGIEFDGQRALQVPPNDLKHRQQCHGISILNSRNVKLIDCHIRGFIGDGVYVGGNRGNAGRGIQVDRCRLSDCGRNGITITDADDVRILNNEIRVFDADPVGPIGGIDLEPNARGVGRHDIWIIGNKITWNVARDEPHVPRPLSLSGGKLDPVTMKYGYTERVFVSHNSIVNEGKHRAEVGARNLRDFHWMENAVSNVELRLERWDR